jgi:hypothetical protein
MALSANLTGQTPPARIPKLKYRNPLPANDHLPALDPPRSRDLQSTIDIHDDPPATPSSTAPSSYCRPSFDTASRSSPSLASPASSVTASDDSTSSKKKKKKTGSVLGFLSLKEPSQVAFEQFAEAQRKQAADKGTRSPTSRPSTSYASKKLPENIPKVNSKWDGVPDSLKSRHPKSTKSIKSSASSNKNRHSVTSQESQTPPSTALPRNDSRASIMTDGTRNPPNSVASPAASVSNLDFCDDTEARSATPTLPEVSFYSPEPIDANVAHAHLSQPLAYHPPVPDSSSRSSGSISDRGSFSDQVPGLRPDSPASSTDSGDTVVRDTADIIFKKLNEQPQKSFWGETPGVQSPEEAIATTVPESHDFLFDHQPPMDLSSSNSPATTPSVPHYAPTRPVQNFSRPMSFHTTSPPARSSKSPSYRTTPVSSGLPTLYEASLASIESDGNLSDETVQDHDDTDAQSIAPSTIAPSELSAHWRDSPRERLGLGGRLRMNAELPWEVQGQGESPGKLKKYRLSMFGKVTPR